MKLYVDFFKIVLHISLVVFVVIYSYIIINGFDIMIKYDDSQLVYENNYIMIHNMNSNRNNILLKIKVNNNEDVINNTILRIDNDFYKLNDLEVIDVYDYKYFVVDNYILKGYETVKYDVSFLTINNDYVIDNLNYDFYV